MACGHPCVAREVRTLSETVRLDARTKLLNPKFYEGPAAGTLWKLRQHWERTRHISTQKSLRQ